MSDPDRSRPPAASAPGPTLSLETTASLFARARAGDDGARDLLMRRHLPVLRRWARGRLPRPARDMVDTDDLVQLTLLRALSHMKDFEPRRPGAFLAYLRRILFNQIRDQIRRTGRRPKQEDLDDGLVDPSASPLDRAIGRQAIERYEAALRRLPAEQQAAIMLRVEAGLNYQEMASVLERPSPNAARLLASRALLRLAEEMRERE